MQVGPQVGPHPDHSDKGGIPFGGMWAPTPPFFSTSSRNQLLFLYKLPREWGLEFLPSRKWLKRVMVLCVVHKAKQKIPQYFELIHLSSKGPIGHLCQNALKDGMQKTALCGSVLETLVSLLKCLTYFNHTLSF